MQTSDEQFEVLEGTVTSGSGDTVGRALVAFGDVFWSAVPNMPDWYVSWAGRLVSFRQRKPRLMKATRTGRYNTVHYCRGRHDQRTLYLHTIVCESWHGPRPAGYHVRHLDGDSTNNCAANLCWGTPSENMADCLRHGTHRSQTRPPGTTLNLTIVAEMCRLRASEGLTYRRLGEMFGVTDACAYMAVSGKSWKGAR
jgi:hypothetical protein